MDPLPRLRRICLALPESSERISHGHPGFFVREKKLFTRYTVAAYDEPGPALWCPAPPGIQGQLVDAEPERFFRPPYVGHRGWLGVRLDVDVDWSEIEGIVRDAFRLVAPKKVSALLD